MIHALVTPVDYFNEVISGNKTAEIKKDDRPYMKGGTILLQEYDSDKKLFTGREVPLTITSIARNIPREGLRRGFVFMCFSVGQVVENELPEDYGKVMESPTIETEQDTGNGDDSDDVPDWVKNQGHGTENVTELQPGQVIDPETLLPKTASKGTKNKGGK